MKRFFTCLLFFISLINVFGQTTVFSDDFNRATLSPGGTPSMTYTNTAATGVTISTNSSTNLRIATGTTSGVSYVTGTTSTFSSPYNTTLSSNSGLITWTFNFRWNRASSNNPAAPTSGSYGQAIILAASSSTLTSGNGYAIVYGNSSTPDPIRLVKYTGGVTGTLTNIISSGSSDIANTNNYVSVRVTYNTSDNQWSLFVRDDGTTTWSDPTSGVTNQISTSTTDNTYTNTSLSTFGFFWSHANSSGNNGDFDNFKVTITPPPSIAISSGSIASDNISQGDVNVILQRYDLAVTTANANLNGLTVTTAGTYAASDLTNLKVRYSTDNVLDAGDATLSTKTSGLAAGSQVFPSFTSQSISSGSTGYLFVTADIASNATAGNTINVATTPFSGISFTSGTKTGTDPVAAGGTKTIVAVTPSVTLSSPAASTANIAVNTTNNVIYRFDLAVTTANANLTGVTINTSGTYLSTDLTNLKCWYSADNTFNSGSDVLLSTKTTSLGVGSHIFPSFVNQSINNGSTGYIFITTDIPLTATPANTIIVDAITTSDISFTSASKSGTADASGTKTIVDCTPTDVTSPAASVGNTTSTLTWTNPICFDEILIVAAAATNTGIPSGNGSTYTGNLSYGSGTVLGNGFVVYKGSTSSQIVTGLTNGTTYFYKFFTRRGTVWSSGTEVSATPVQVTVSSDYFRSNVASGNWGTAASWESSSDNSTWITATLAPTSAANTITIRSGHNITVNSAQTADQLVIANGGTLTHTSGLTVNNGTGDDITVENGGTFIYTTLPTYSSSNIRVNSGGVLSVQGSSMTSNGTGVNATTHNYDDGAILEWNLATGNPSSGNVNYFPNVDANTVPIFRFATTTNGGTFGANTQTTINGILNIASGVTITLSGTGASASKTFRNGISGAGNLTQGSSTGQQIIINGSTAVLTGSGTLTIDAPGLSIDNANTINGDKLIAGVGAITKTGAGTLNLTNSANTYSGGTTISGGTLSVNGPNRLGDANGTLTINAGTFQLITTGVSSGRNIVLGNSASTIDISASSYTATNLAIVSGIGGLTKIGAGRLELQGANTYTGLTTVSAGTFKLNRTGGATIPATNNVSVTGGTLQISTNQTLNNLTVNGGNVTVDDGVTLTINGTLTLTSGKITLGTGSVVIGSSGSISGGSATSYVATTGTGALTINGIGTPSVSFPIGTAAEYLPITAFTNTGTPDNFSAKVSTSSAPTCAVAASALTATWDIAEAIIGSSIVSMTIQYNGSTSRGASFSNATAKLFHCSGSFADVTGAAGASGGDPYTISASNFTSFSPFGVSSDVVLSTEIIAIKATKGVTSNNISWQTATEQNASHFNIERSNNGQTNWKSMGTVKAVGNSHSIQDYQFTDNAPLSMSYYRLRSVDFDGKETVSNVVSVLSDKKDKLQVYPSPAKDKLFIRSENTVQGTPFGEGSSFEVFDLLGRNVLRGTLTTQKELNIAELAAGTYVLKVGSDVVKFVKE